MKAKDKKISKENQSKCPECLVKCSVEELKMFGGVCPVKTVF